MPRSSRIRLIFLPIWFVVWVVLIPPKLKTFSVQDTKYLEMVQNQDGLCFTKYAGGIQSVMVRHANVAVFICVSVNHL